MEKLKRIAALTGVILLVFMYLFSLFAALFAKSYAKGLFLGSLLSTVFIPVLLYIIIRSFEIIKNNREKGMTIHEIRKAQKTGMGFEKLYQNKDGDGLPANKKNDKSDE